MSAELIERLRMMKNAAASEAADMIEALDRLVITANDTTTRALNHAEELERENAAIKCALEAITNPSAMEKSKAIAVMMGSGGDPGNRGESLLIGGAI